MTIPPVAAPLLAAIPGAHVHTDPSPPTSAWWITVAVANGVLLVAYTAISLTIAKGLWVSGQWRRNLLGMATACIFLTCAVHHGSHTVHMTLPVFGLAVEPGLAMRAAVGHDFHIAAWDVLTAAVGVWYWGLRSRFPALVKGAAVFDDIRLREAGERALRASEERYRRIVETTAEGVVTLDLDGRITYANRQLASMVGRPAQELVGCPAAELVVDGDHGELDARLSRRLLGHVERYDLRLRHTAGHDVRVQVVGTPLHDEHGAPDGALAMITDVTEQRSLEAQFRQSQKLEAVGQLAGGVAHDFNNLLTVIDGYAAVLVDDATPPVRRDLEAIRAAAHRAHGLTRQLLTFSRTQVTRPEVLDLRAIVADVEDMLGRLIGEDIALRTEPAEQPVPVRVDRGQLEQVLVNLVVNARDAMPDGGQLTVSTGATTLGPGQAQHGGMAAGAYGVLAVADGGAGMSAEVQARVFEPFYTTKEPGKGTGLGLSTVYGIVREAGGNVTVDSAPGRGTTFRICLPLATGAPSATPATNPGTDRLTTGQGETILLVEDERAVRELAERILRQAGYAVLAAGDAEQALALFGERSVDLVLTDVIMPGLNGRQLAERLVAQQPTLRVLFTSAYSRGIISERGILHHSVSYLEKPYTPARLTATVRTVLSAPTPPDGAPARAAADASTSIDSDVIGS